MPKIAILGWGSLVWDARPAFDNNRGAWEPVGPELRIEFSRVSSSRSGALTLVIDPYHGSLCRVSYALSTRSNAEDAVDDLRSREGTTRDNIGVYFRDGSPGQSRDEATLNTVKRWAQDNHIDVTVWTDLSSNFDDKIGKPYSVEAALAHIQGLPPDAKTSALQYVVRAPNFVQTIFRTELQAAPWFLSAAEGFLDSHQIRSN